MNSSDLRCNDAICAPWTFLLTSNSADWRSALSTQLLVFGEKSHLLSLFPYCYHPLSALEYKDVSQLKNQSDCINTTTPLVTNSFRRGMDTVSS